MWKVRKFGLAGDEAGTDSLLIVVKIVVAPAVTLPNPTQAELKLSILKIRGPGSVAWPLAIVAVVPDPPNVNVQLPFRLAFEQAASAEVAAADSAAAMMIDRFMNFSI